MSYGDYVEQLTYLLFLKMADERTKPPYNQPSAVPAKYNPLPPHVPHCRVFYCK
jgi:type I restriction enzyme M protein